MSYNVRVYDYFNSQEVRIYSQTVSENDSKTVGIISDDIKRSKCKSKNDDDERSKRVSQNRSKNAIYEIARANEWEYFITLTFRRDRDDLDSSDYSALIKKVRVWFNHLKARKCPDLKYLLIPELHKDGKHYHFHGLIANCQGLILEDSGVKHNGKTVFNITEFNKFGFSSATKVQDTKKVSSYICKYITKDLEQALKGKRRYIASNNVERAKIVDYNMTSDEIETMILDLAQNCTFMKTQDIPQAHQRVRYMQISKG